MRLWVVAYDIADNHRRRRLAKLLATRMERIQESVFEGWLNAADVRALLLEVSTLIEKNADTVRAYPLACREVMRHQTLGAQKSSAPPVGHWIV